MALVSRNLSPDIPAEPETELTRNNTFSFLRFVGPEENTQSQTNALQKL